METCAVATCVVTVRVVTGGGGREMASLVDWSLIDYTARLISTAAGAAAAIVLIARRGHRWWLRTVPAVLAVAVALAAAATSLADRLQLFRDYSMPLAVPLWIGIATAGIGFGMANLPGATWRRRMVAVAAATVVLLSAAAGVNAFYGHLPNLRSALDLPPADEIDFSALPPPVPEPVPLDRQRPLEARWSGPVDLPGRGAVARVHIAGPVSGFRTSRDAFIYLPPAYLTAHRPLLPVLILVHSSPGEPSDWINGGQLSMRLDGFAAAHHGLAPIVVVPDTTGTLMANPMCVDSALGNSETYMTRDVPDFIRSHLQVEDDTRLWAVGGYSSGGTCALQLALRRPDLFPTFVDIAGQVEPTLGTRSKTVDLAFGGDSATFDRLTPLDILSRTQLPGTAGRIYDGADDRPSIAEQQTVLAACRRNGIDIDLTVVPGGHTWYAWARAFEQALPWLAIRQGISSF